MRLTRQRLVLRAVLLTVACGVSAGRALDDGRKAAGAALDPGIALFHSRMALVEWILAGLALLTALAALASLRQPSRRRLLRLGHPVAGGAETPAGPEGEPPPAPREPPGPGRGSNGAEEAP